MATKTEKDAKNCRYKKTVSTGKSQSSKPFDIQRCYWKAILSPSNRERKSCQTQQIYPQHKLPLLFLCNQSDNNNKKKETKNLNKKNHTAKFPCGEEIKKTVERMGSCAHAQIINRQANNVLLCMSLLKKSLLLD